MEEERIIERNTGGEYSLAVPSSKAVAVLLPSH